MFHTLDDYKKKEDPRAKDKKKTTESYTGGKESGIAVDNPEDDDYIEKMKGYDNPDKYKQTKNKIRLTCYKNGFQIDDGPFRPIDKEENKKFMKEVDKGYIPDELVKKGYKDLGIEMVNKRSENYQEPIPEKKFEAFVGSGKSLGNVNVQGLSVNKNVSSSVDNSKPTCKINIRLFNGQMINEVFNLTQTLYDVFLFVQKASGSHNFELLDGFPPKPIREMNKTIEELHIQGSTLTQKIK